MEIGVNGAGETVWAETELRYADETEPTIISSSTDKQVACPNNMGITGSRTLREIRRRNL